MIYLIYLNMNENDKKNNIVLFIDNGVKKGRNKIQDQELNKQQEVNKKTNLEKDSHEYNKYEEINEDNEKSPLIKNEKLIKILNNINNKLKDEKNKDKDIEEIYENYNNKDEDKRVIKSYYSEKYIYFMLFFTGGIFVIINLIGIFTIRTIMNSLYEILIISIQNFLYKKSDLEKYDLTDFESYYNSSYNFYEQYFNDISKNEVDFDLMMFWDFVGSFVYKYCEFECTSFLFLILNIIFLVLIGGFDFLDINEKTHKYSFFQILYITLVYFFLWISVSSSALLSQQIYIESFEILNKKIVLNYKQKEELKEKEKRQAIERIINKTKKKEQQKQEEEQEIPMSNNNFNIEDKGHGSEIQRIIKKSDKLNGKSNGKEEKKYKKNEDNEFQYHYMIYLSSFLGFLINYIINREIIFYKTIRKYK